jgi:hypothetical protein
VILYEYYYKQYNVMRTILETPGLGGGGTNKERPITQEQREGGTQEASPITQEQRERARVFFDAVTHANTYQELVSAVRRAKNPATNMFDLPVMYASQRGGFGDPFGKDPEYTLVNNCTADEIADLLETQRLGILAYFQEGDDSKAFKETGVSAFDFNHTVSMVPSLIQERLVQNKGIN